MRAETHRAGGSPATETTRLYTLYSTQILGYCRARLRSHEDAEDAAQNTFLRAYAALERGVVPEFESAWLHKIAQNVCLGRKLGRLRRSKVETPRDLTLLEERLPVAETRPDELDGLDEALAALPANLRRAILLREWQGLSYAEIARDLGVSYSAVETLVFRARRQLARALDSSVRQPAQRVASALNVAPLMAAIRSLLASGGAAKLAAGAVVAVGVASGGFVLGTSIEASDKPAATVSRKVKVPPTSDSAVPADSRAEVSAHPGRRVVAPARALGVRSRPAIGRPPVAPHRAGPGRPAAPVRPVPRPLATPAPALASTGESATATAAEEAASTTTQAVAGASAKPAPTQPTTTTTATQPVPPTVPTAPSAPSVPVPSVPTPSLPAIPPIEPPTVPLPTLPPPPPLPPVPSAPVPSLLLSLPVPTPTVPSLPAPTLPLPPLPPLP